MSPWGAAVAVLVLLLVVAGALVSLGWRASSHAMHPGPPAYAWAVGDYPNLEAEEVTVTSRTGVKLAGRFFPGRDRATVVLSHGYGGNQDELLPVASSLHDAGFSVFSYDLRGCGRSGGEVTFGAKEAEDLRSVLDYVSTRPDVEAEKIGALGFSMGAAATILTAAHDDRIKAVVDDSGWSDVDHWLRPTVRAVFLHPTDRFSALSLKFVELRADVEFDRLRPADEIGRLAPRPILIIHGTADDVVPPGDSEENLAAAGEEKELWLVNGATHGQTMLPAGATSSERVIAFFEGALRSSPGSP